MPTPAAIQASRAASSSSTASGTAADGPSVPATAAVRSSAAAVRTLAQAAAVGLLGEVAVVQERRPRGIPGIEGQPAPGDRVLEPDPEQRLRVGAEAPQPRQHLDLPAGHRGVQDAVQGQRGLGQARGGPVGQVDQRVVAGGGAHGQVGQHVDAQGREVGRGAETGHEEQVRRADGARAEHDLARPDRPAVGQHPHRPPPLDEDPADVDAPRTARYGCVRRGSR